MHIKRFSIPRCSIALGFLKRIAIEWSTDNATTWSASVAFYTVLFLAPLLILTVAIAGVVYDKRVAQAQLVLGLRDLLGPEIGPAIQVLLTSPRKPVTSLIATLSRHYNLVFRHISRIHRTSECFECIWHVPAHGNRTHFANFLRVAKQRVYSFLMILALGLLLLVSLVLNSWLGTMTRFFGWQMLASGYLLHVTVFFTSCLVITFVFSAVYKLIPNVRLNWSDVSIGGGVTAILFIIGKQIIALYIGR